MTRRKLATVFLLAASLVVSTVALGASADHTGGQLRNGQSSPDIDPKCSEGQFLGHIIQDDAFRRALSIKSRTGYMGQYRAEDSVAFNVHHYYADLREGVGVINRVHPTYVLVYSSKGCVWLLNRSGWVMASGIARSRIAQASLWSALNVSATSRSRLLPSRRKRGDACETRPVIEFPARSADEKSKTDLALAVLTEELLPSSIRAKLTGSELPARLVIVPTGNLRSVPFHALRVNGRYLVDLYAVLVSPTINTLRVAAGPLSQAYWGASRTDASSGGASPRRLIVGNPDLSGHSKECWTNLPHAEKEAKYAARKFNVAPLIGLAAGHDDVLSRLTAEASELDLIYFATHGFSDPVNPADGSFLALSGRHLKAAELRTIGSKFKRKPIVVMSACQSGLGKEFAGGMFGLAELWRYAGAAQVAISLWDVSDSGTERLMKLFVDYLIDHGMRDAEFAMADAMRDLKKTDSDPAIWAAFTIFGDVRP